MSLSLAPGLTRRQVEGYFRTKGTTFIQSNWVEERAEEETAFADLVRIGDEPPPWFCGGRGVYIAFEFAATASHKPQEAYDSDVLKKVRIFRMFGELFLRPEAVTAAVRRTN